MTTIPTTRQTLPTTALALLLLAASLGCGGGGGSSSPTEPTNQQLLSLEVFVRNVDGLDTLEELSLAFDGVLQGTTSLSPASSTTPPMHFSVNQATPGRHVLRATVLRQTDSPSRYVMTATGTWGSLPVAADGTATEVATEGDLEVFIDL